MFPAINLGPLVIPTGPLTLLLGAWLCLTLAERLAKSMGQDEQAVSGLVTAGLITGVIGARLTFVFLHWPAYQNNLLGIIWPLNSGFSSVGGILFGGAAMFFYGRSRQLPPWKTLDLLSPIFITGLMVISLADFLGGPGYGTFTNMPWGITQFEIRRHPVQLYEILVGAAALLTWQQMRKRQQFAGQLFLASTAVYCFGRLFVDAFRVDAWVINGWHLLQIICLIVTLGCLAALAHKSAQGHATEESV